MAEDFRTRMGSVLEEIQRLTAQAEEWEQIAQKQQAQIEELDLLVRQRDEQLAEQQARVEELEEALRQRDQELETLRRQLAESAARPHLEEELAILRERLAEKEAVEIALRKELAHLSPAPPAEGPPPAPDWAAPLGALAEQVRAQGEALASMRVFLQEEMARLHGRLDRLEVARLEAPAAAVAPPAPAVFVPVEAPPEIALPPEIVPPAAAPVAPPVAAPPFPAPEEPLQAVLYEALDMLPAATCIGLASLDGLSVEMMVRQEQRVELPLEIELADLTREAARVTAAMGIGPLLTLAFQTGDEHCLISPVGEDHFAFLLSPLAGGPDLRRAQAILLQTAIRLNEIG